MVLLASAGLSSLMSSWPRMQSGQKNPFQNAPGPFIYALPNLAGTCPLSYSSDTSVSLCSFSGDPNAPPASDPHPHPQHHNHHQRRFHTSTTSSPAVVTSRSSCCCQHDPPPSESAEPPTGTGSTKEGGPDTQLPPPRLSPSDESHFCLGDDINPSPLPESGTEPLAEQQQESQTSELSSTPPSTPTHSTTNTSSSPARSDFREEGPKGEGERNEYPEKGGRRTKRKRRKRANGRRKPGEQGVNSIAPRFMGLSGIHYGLWTQYVCRQAQAPPPAMNNHHHAWPVTGYHHPAASHDALVVPPNSLAPAPLFWNPMVQAVQTPGFVAVPVAS